MSTAPEADPNRIISAAAQASAAACGQRRSRCCAGWERRMLAAGRPRSRSHAHNQCVAGVRPAVRQELAPPAAESWAAHDGIPRRGRSVVARRSGARACARQPCGLAQESGQAAAGETSGTELREAFQRTRRTHVRLTPAASAPAHGRPQAAPGAPPAACPPTRPDPLASRHGPVPPTLTEWPPLLP